MTSVLFRRKTLEYLLRRALTGEFIIVRNPDHPLLMHAPDILVASRAGTFALFTPTEIERRVPRNFMSRYILSRLALPPYTRSLLVAEASDRHIIAKHGRDFAEVIPWSSRREIPKIVADASFVGRHKDLPPEVVKDVQRIYGDALGVTRSAERHRRIAIQNNQGISGSMVPFDHSSKRLDIRRDSPDFMQGVSLALADQALDSKVVTNLVNSQADYLYVLDTGVPYRKGTQSGIALVRSIPPEDTGKLFHAAAFGGWALIGEEQSPLLETFSRQLAKGQS